MKKMLFVLAISLAITGLLLTQRQRASPHHKGEFTVEGKKVSIEYGRPYLKGRTIGKDLAEFGKRWRMGADESTTLVTEAGLMIGTLNVPAGTYTLGAVPGEKAWTLIVNKQTGQWGTEYKEAMDLGRVDMKVSSGPSVEQLTLEIANGQFTMHWGTVVGAVAVKLAK